MLVTSGKCNYTLYQIYMHNNTNIVSSPPTYKYFVALIAGNYLVNIVGLHKEIHRTIWFVKKMLLCRQLEKRRLPIPIVQQTDVSACIVDSPQGIKNDFNRRSWVKRRPAESLISIMGWDRRWKRKYPAGSDKIVTGQRNRIIDPREEGKFLFWRGVNYC